MATAKTKTRSKAAPKPPSRKIEDKAQFERFREFAREHGADDDLDASDRKFQKIIGASITRKSS
jgi:hypothetical protein